MQEHVTVTINGARVRAPKGAYMLEVALGYGICIPHLCHVKTLLPTGACRLCIVEAVKDGKSKVTASCTLEAEEGMVIEAHSEKIIKVRYPFRNSDCVLCGRCVRACDELWQSHSLGFVGRGANRRVMLPFDQRPSTCKMCLACVEICPMNLPPCNGYMEEGKEALCGRCESQVLSSRMTHVIDACIDCRLGENFHCYRKPGL
jgi:NADH dehydrogenase/NADH:ubiquinone oxidoreductase subunit G